MRKRILIIIAAFLVFLSLEARAGFANSDIYKTGVLPNGVEYYFVNNSSVKGIVDIALVQRNPGDIRALLDSLNGFGQRSPGKYMIDRGVAYSRRGYAFEEDGAAIYRFHDVPVGASLDSTLFMLANLFETSPSTQTLIMCGDITPATMIDRIGLLTMSQSPRSPLPEPSEYTWRARTERTVEYIDNGKEHSALVSIRFYIPRLQKAAMMTVQPVFSRFFSACLTALLRDRMNVVFKNQNIAYSDLKAIYLSSADGSGDESYTITFKVLTEELPQAMNCMASVMSGINRDGVTTSEFGRVNSRVLDFLAEKVRNVSQTNAGYVRSCLNACLYGASLTSPQDFLNYFSQRQFGADQITYFFNRFTRAMLDKTKTASFKILASNGPDLDMVMESFDRGWLNPVTPEVSSVPKFESVMPKLWAPVGIKRELGDNISGGTMWRFSNGMKVIFKRTSGDVMNYYLVIRGGIQNIENPRPGETAFVQDMFKLCGVGSLSHSDFDLVLASKGISIKSFADNNGLTLYGQVPVEELAYLPAALAQLSKLTLPSKEDMDYYRKCVMTEDEVPLYLMNYQIDHLLRPEDDQLVYKFSRNITDSTAIKALNYYKKQFSRMNDGAFMIFGDINPERVWRILHQHIGVLSTVRRPATTYWTERPQITTGVNIVVDSLAAMEINSARIRMKIAKPITRENNFTFTLATMCVEETMQKLLYERGFNVSSLTGYSLYPEDTFTVTFDLRPCVPYGLPAHIGDPASVFDVLADIHSALKSGEDVSTARLALYKTILTSKLSNELTDESKLIAYTLLRYAAGKNMTSDYKSQISAVSEAAVREMAGEILSAGRVEYIVR